MRTVSAVGGQPPRHGKDRLHQFGIEMKEKRAVKEQGAAPAILRVAGKFQIPETQIGKSLNSNLRPDNVLQSLPEALHDEAIRLGDAGQWGGISESQDQRIVQAAGALEHRSSPGEPPQDGDAMGSAGRQIHFQPYSARISEDDKVLVGFPESQNFPVSALAEIDQGLVAGEVLRRRGQGQIEMLERVRIHAVGSILTRDGQSEIQE